MYQYIGHQPFPDMYCVSGLITVIIVSAAGKHWYVAWCP